MEFETVAGPPRITMSVARGIDDHQERDLTSLAQEQRHHMHWKNVTKEEMAAYYDTWCFMDCEAFRFYLPAFMMGTLQAILNENHQGEPAWMTTGFYYPKRTQIECFSPAQKLCFSKFLEIVSLTILHPLDREHFQREKMTPWKDLLVNSPNKASV